MTNIFHIAIGSNPHIEPSILACRQRMGHLSHALAWFPCYTFLDKEMCLISSVLLISASLIISGMERRYEMPSTSSKIAAYLLGLLCGSVPLLMFTLALFSRTEESQLVGFIVGVILQLLATFLMFLLTLPQRTRPIAYGLFIPLLIAVCLEIFGHFSLQPITSCSAILLLLATLILFVSWIRKWASNYA